MEHPLVAAWQEYNAYQEMNLHVESWYYDAWLELLLEAKEHYQDLLEHYSK